MDILSFIASTIGFGALLYGFSNAGNYAWTDARCICSTYYRNSISYNIYLETIKIR